MAVVSVDVVEALIGAVVSGVVVVAVGVEVAGCWSLVVGDAVSVVCCPSSAGAGAVATGVVEDDEVSTDGVFVSPPEADPPSAEVEVFVSAVGAGVVATGAGVLVSGGVFVSGAVLTAGGAAEAGGGAEGALTLPPFWFERS